MPAAVADGLTATNEDFHIREADIKSTSIQKGTPQQIYLSGSFIPVMCDAQQIRAAPVWDEMEL